MKKFFLVTFIVAIIFPQSVFAEDGIYLKGSVGLFSLDDSNFEFKDDVGHFDIGDFESKIGFGLSTAIGKSFTSGFDLELEYAYKEAKLDKFSSNHPAQIPDVVLDSSIQINSLMSNAIYNFRNASVITPYVGAGIGVAWIDIEDFSDTEFAYQLLAGVALSVSKNTSITAGYRYFASKDISDNEINGSEESLSIDSHNFELGLKYSF